MSFDILTVECRLHSFYPLSKCFIYIYIYEKEQFCFELFLDKIHCKSLRSALTRLRVSSHRLRIESESRVDRNDKTCQFCDAIELKDEYHFVSYEDRRSKYIKRYFYIRPSMAKFIEY
jgi:hypothetical protein